MNIHEYQAKDVLRKYGVAVLQGKVVTTPDEAEAAAQDLGGGLCVVKAQIHAGGRGKAGGVKLAQTPQEAREQARHGQPPAGGTEGPGRGPAHELPGPVPGRGGA